MAKKNQVYIDIVIDDNGTTKRVAVNAKKLGIELDKAGVGADKAGKGTDKLSKSQKTLDRNMRGTAKMSSNTTKEFSKMSQGMGGLVGAYATLAAQVFAVSAAFQFLQSASDFRNLINGQEALGASTGVVYKSITNNLIRATDAQLKYADAAKAAAIGSAAGLTSQQLTHLSSAAKNASFALGRDLTDSFNRLIRGVTKAEPELLDELGIILRLEPATKKYAASIGKTVKELTAYERTQAVANEVLEQANRKFGNLEGMMDPAAATLAQFTRSFDELVNTFKVGILTFVTPGLKFLAENTMGLVGALSLVALPILKAILPSMDAWIIKIQEVQATQRIASDKRIADLAEEQLAVQNSMRTNEQKLKQDQNAAKQLVKDRGIKPTGAAMAFMTGGKKTVRGEQASEAMLAKARKELDLVEGERTTSLKHMQKEELDLMEESHRQRVKTTKEGTNVMVNSQKKIVSVGTKASRAWSTAWGGAMKGVAVIAKGTALAINFAFKAIAFVGFALLAIDLVKQLRESMNPLTDEQKREREVVDDLAASYKDLGVELEKSRQFRNNQIGSDQIKGLGQAFQGADVPKIIKDINSLNSAADKSTKGWKKAREALNITVKQVTLMAPGFEDLTEAMESGTRVANANATAMRGVAAAHIEAGQASTQYIQDQKDLEELLSKLGQDAAQVSTISDAQYMAARAEKGARAERNINRLSVKDQVTRIEAASTAIPEYARLQKKKEELEAAGLPPLGMETSPTFFQPLESIKMAYAQTSVVEDEKGMSVVQIETQETLLARLKEHKQVVKEMEAITGKNHIISEEMLETAKETLKVGREEIRNETEKVGRYEALNTMLKKREAVRLAHAIKMIRIAKEDAEQRTRGLTIGAKLKNIELDRAKAKSKVDEAENSLKDKIALQKDATGTKEIAQAEENTRIARLRYELEVALQEQGEVILKDKEAALGIDKEGLAIAQRAFNIKRNILSLQRSMKIESAVGGDTRAAQSAQRADEVRLLRLQKTAQELDNKKLRERAKKVRDDALAENAALPPKDRETEESVKFQISQGTEATALRTGQDALANTTDQLEIYRRMPEAVLNTNRAKIEQLKLDQQGVFLLGEKGILHDLERDFFEKTKRVANAEEMAFLTAQAEAIWQLNENIRMQEELVSSISTNMTNAFMSIVQGTQSAKEAFKQMAASIISDLAAMIIKAMIFKAISAAFGGMGASSGASKSMSGAAGSGSGRYGGMNVAPVPEYMKLGGRYGGVFEPEGYRAGGIASGRDAGYPAVLHGTEAVVPIGMNRKIPVEMVNGGGAQNNNVTVNVSMDSSGNAQQNTQQDGAQAGKLGNMIANAVQQELQFQKRSGGILNPYGVA